MVLNAAGEVNLYVLDTCKNLVECLEKHSIDPNTGKPFKNTKWDDIFDGASYCAQEYSPLTKKGTKISGFRR